MLALAGTAEAQDAQGGLYISGGAGLDQRLGFKIRGAEYMSSLMGSPALSGGRADIRSSLGLAGVAAVGYDFGGPRLELEGNYRSVSVRQMREFGRSLTDVSGSTRSYGTMGNAYYDINLGRYGQIGGTRVTPYVGAGFGFGVTSFDKVRGRLPANGTSTMLNGTSELAPAYQVMAGTSLGLDSLAPGLSATVEYRYYTVFNREITTTVNNPGTSPLGVNANLTRPTLPNCCHDHSVMLGLRYAFGRSATALPPTDTIVPAPRQAAVAPVRTYLVMFGLNSATLDGAARETVRTAAAAARAGQAVRVALTGRADNTGPAALNRRLSRQRAEAVAAEMTRDGVARSAISIAALGDTAPMVPSPPGVPEPRNRSVEIVLR